ncbi:MAG: sulfotransferase domain-containing protein [Bacteroidia bacterium]
MPRTIKQYFRKFLVSIGQFDEGAFRLAIDKIYVNDTFLVSYPKSGNTWLRFLIANLIHPDQKINFRNIDQFVPDVYSATDFVNRMHSPRFIKAHHPWFDIFPKSIYIVRDYRDVFVSYYQYQKKLGVFNGSIEDFATQIDLLHPFGTWDEHIHKALDLQEIHPRKILFLKYEDLYQHPDVELKRIVQFLDLKPALSVEEIIQRCSFQSLQELENKHGSQFKDLSNSNFFREGKPGSWKTELPHDLAEMLTNLYAEPLARLGYESN